MIIFINNSGKYMWARGVFYKSTRGLHNAAGHTPEEIYHILKDDGRKFKLSLEF